MPDAALARLAARADLCRLLAACFYEPAPEFIEEAMFDSLAGAAAQVDPALAALADGMAQDFLDESLEALRIDYTRLFLHPTLPQALPYASSWLGSGDPMARQAALDAVVGAYRDGGFDLDEGFRDLPDHIAAELEFLYTVLFREAGAQHAQDDEGRAAAGEMRRSFLERHLARWVDPFTDAMQAGAETAFYRRLAKLTSAFVAYERSQAA